MDQFSKLTYEQSAPTIAYLQRVSQIFGKYSLEQPYYFAYSKGSLTTTPHGFISDQYYGNNGLFWFDLDLYKSELRLHSVAGSGRVSLQDNDTIQDFYKRFLAEAVKIGINPPVSDHQTEIKDPKQFTEDSAGQQYDPEVARQVTQICGIGSAGLKAWQSNYIGFASMVGMMWGSFDLVTARYNGKPTKPMPDKPYFHQNSELSQDVTIGLWFGSPEVEPCFYSYINPQPQQTASYDFSQFGASWMPKLGFVVMPIKEVVNSSDPIQKIIDFGDLNYQLALDYIEWPKDLTIERTNGLEAAERLISLPNLWQE